MKKLVLSLSLLMFLLPGLLFSQEKEGQQVREPATKLEEFLAKKGKIFIKDSYEIGTLTMRMGSAEFDALVLYEPGMEGQRRKGLRIEVKQPGRIERTHTSMLDLEEIESLSQAVSYMINLAGKWKAENRAVYTEVTFSTKGEFQVGFYQKGLERSIYMVSGHISRASCYGGIEDLGKLKEITDKGLSILKQK
jgi:hypothetical protein